MYICFLLDEYDYHEDSVRVACDVPLEYMHEDMHGSKITRVAMTPVGLLDRVPMFTWGISMMK